MVLALAGCGGNRATVASCLNADGFLVQQAGNVVRGSSALGVNFTLTLYPHRYAARRAFEAGSPVSSVLLGNAVVDFAGDPAALPGGAPGRLSKGALATIRRCLVHP